MVLNDFLIRSNPASIRLLHNLLQILMRTILRDCINENNTDNKTVFWIKLP